MNFNTFNVKITTEEMLFAAQIFNSVFENKAPIPDLFGIEPPDDGNSYLMLSNIPINRANIALLDAFKEDRNKGAALGFRLMSMTKFLQDGRAKKWIRKEDRVDMLHQNIFAALAKYKITKNDEKNKENFFKELEKLGGPEEIQQAV